MCRNVLLRINIYGHETDVLLAALVISSPGFAWNFPGFSSGVIFIELAQSWTKVDHSTYFSPLLGLSSLV